MSQMAYKRWNSKLEKYFQKKQQIVFGNSILEIPLEKKQMWEQLSLQNAWNLVCLPL